MIDTSELDTIIVGRVEPHIYAFFTNTIPNYLKVGDTYRPVLDRLNEWRLHYPDLRKEFEGNAKIGDEAYFRDYSVHQYLIDEKHRERLKPEDIQEDVYYSKEFFKDASATDITEAIDDIEANYKSKTNKYQYYSPLTLKAEEVVYSRSESYQLRPNQEIAVNRFDEAIKNGRTNLLMYAVMRFGKTFTSMCCALKMNAKLVVIVSAKVDVLHEWKKTVESHIKFAEYDFISPDIIKKNPSVVSDRLLSGRKIVVFLSLQDLNGKSIKAKHIDILNQNIDLLIVDETHFGARSEKYGDILKNSKKCKKSNITKKDLEDSISIDNADSIVKLFKTKIILHLSGTPYRILMGNEFKTEDIIAYYQLSDIIKDQEDWDHINKSNPEGNVKDDWENPYFGFPQMIRFAFHPNESSRKKLDELEKSGVSYAFSDLFEPHSLTKSDMGDHKKFKYEKEILDLLETIDGSRDDNHVLGFLNYDKIKNGKMCRHIVIVLPYCSSCDALESLILNNKTRFKNLNEYEILNISGWENKSKYAKQDAIINRISELERDNIKTITLTVNRMLTGSTVKEWDTMLYFKDTISAQEYDQAIFRLQTQYIKIYTDSSNNKIAINMKPQTLLVDFDPSRMFLMQESRSKIYNPITDNLKDDIESVGNAGLSTRIEDELRISPIFTINKDKIERVNTSNILEAISNYKKNKGIVEEAQNTPVDLSILEDPLILKDIILENEIGSKYGLSIIPYTSADDGDSDGESSNLDVDIDDNLDEDNSSEQKDSDSDNEDKNENTKFVKKVQSYYTRILLFAFVTNSDVKSLSDIIKSLNTPDNLRIAKNLGLKIETLSHIARKTNAIVLSSLDYKIQDLNNLSNDKDISPLDKATIAVNKFGKMGKSIVITPSVTSNGVINQLSDEYLLSVVTNGEKFLDIASTSGEFAISLYYRLSSLNINKTIISNIIYNIPKSPICYELTRKIYDFLGISVDNIAECFNSYELINVKKNNKKTIDYDKVASILSQNKSFNQITLDDIVDKSSTFIKFGAIVGNPPYQLGDGGGEGSSATPIYQYYIELSRILKPRYIAMIIPARWYSGGKGLDDFRNEMLNDKRIEKLHDFPVTNDCFPNISSSGLNIRGGVCYFLWNKDYYEDTMVYNHSKNIVNPSIRPLLEEGTDTFIRYNDAISIYRKVRSFNEETMEDRVSSRLPFKIPSDFNKYSEVKSEEYSVILYRSERKKTAPKLVYISPKYITKNIGWKDELKVLVSKASPGGDEYPHAVISTPIFAKENSVCTETYLIVDFVKNSKEAENLISYMSTRFFRFMMMLIKNTQNISKGVFAFVPVQDWNIKWTDEMLYEKYGINDDEKEFIKSLVKPMEIPEFN